MFGVERIRVPECRQDHCQMPGDWDPGTLGRVRKMHGSPFWRLEPWKFLEILQALQQRLKPGVLLHGSRALLGLGPGPQKIPEVPDYWQHQLAPPVALRPAAVKATNAEWCGFSNHFPMVFSNWWQGDCWHVSIDGRWSAGQALAICTVKLLNCLQNHIHSWISKNRSGKNDEPSAFTWRGWNCQRWVPFESGKVSHQAMMPWPENHQDHLLGIAVGHVYYFFEAGRHILVPCFWQCYI